MRFSPRKAHLAPLFFVVVCAADCRVEQVSAVGRPCTSASDCGAEATCDPSSRRCVVRGAASDGLHDVASDRVLAETASTDVPSVVDAPVTTERENPPDQPVQIDRGASDGGCVPPKVRCGTVCVDTQTDTQHCNGCGNACPAGVADRCASGKCLCGAAADRCSGGLNCVGSVCKCVTSASGECKGGCCAANNTCVLFANQTTQVCGVGGAGCTSCMDTNQCTLNSCKAGVCAPDPRPPGTTCPGGMCLGTLCCQGCIAGGGTTCLAGDSVTACGLGGTACQVCPGNGPCRSAMCNSEGACVVDDVVDGTKCQAGSGRCVKGTCCQGCITAAGTCEPGTSLLACGKAGGPCASCGGAQTCTNGLCSP